MRQASADLFPTDVPIPASQMIGRRADVDEVAGALIGGTNLIVAGPRRTGKTSVCDAALNRARRQGLYVASLDLFRVADTAELAETLALAVIANRSAARLRHRAEIIERRCIRRIGREFTGWRNWARGNWIARARRGNICG